MHDRLAVTCRRQRRRVKMKESRDACTCFTVGACYSCQGVQDCRRQDCISVFALWFVRTARLPAIALPSPAHSRKVSLLSPSTPLAHLDTQPLQSRRVQDKDDVCTRRGLCLRPVQHTHTTHTHKHTHTHIFRQTKSMRALTVNPASGSCGREMGRRQPICVRISRI